MTPQAAVASRTWNPCAMSGSTFHFFGRSVSAPAAARGRTALAGIGAERQRADEEGAARQRDDERLVHAAAGLLQGVFDVRQQALHDADLAVNAQEIDRAEEENFSFGSVLGFP